jgi:hypothetical protein
MIGRKCATWAFISEDRACIFHRFKLKYFIEAIKTAACVYILLLQRSMLRNQGINLICVTNVLHLLFKKTVYNKQFPAQADLK